MAEKELIDYIKQTKAQGFSNEQIADALKQAGWQPSDIDAGFKEVDQPEEKTPPQTPAEAAPTEIPSESETDLPGLTAEAKSSFFADHKKMIIGAAILILILVIILIAILLLSNNNTNNGDEQRITTTTEPNPPTNTQNQIPQAQNNTELEQQQAEAELAAARERDQIRLADIQDLQTALTTYFETNASYPENLVALTETELITALPRDPSSLEPYLYTSFGDPRVYYALSFLLETDVGILKAGLQVTTSDTPLSLELINNTESAVQGVSTENLSEQLSVTDLSQIPYFPKEEITLSVEPNQNLELIQVFMITDALKLSDQNPPFRFRFTAPSAPGTYQVKIVGFDKQGTSYSQLTNFTVRDQ